MRWSVHRLMIGVACVAALIWLGQLGTRWEYRREKAREHAGVESANVQLAELYEREARDRDASPPGVISGRNPGLDVRTNREVGAIHRRLAVEAALKKRTFERAARQPWEPGLPDPPTP